MRCAVATGRLVHAIALLGATILVALVPLNSRAQSDSQTDVRVTVGGILQAETTYGWTRTDEAGDGRERIGYGLRRTRLLATAQLGPKAGAFVQLDADGGTFGILDAFAIYTPAPRIRLRLGRMASAQPRAFILTPVIVMDANERAAIALLWHRGTLGSKGRDFGFDFRYLGEQIEAMVFVHNGNGSFDRARGNYQPNILEDVTGGIDRGLRTMAVSGYVAYSPKAVAGLELGAFAGYNGSRNQNTEVEGAGRRYFSYAAHLYWGAEPGSRPARLKADVIGVRYEQVGAVAGQHSIGFSMLGAAAVHQAAEFFGRLEVYFPDSEVQGIRDFFATAGVSFSPSRMRGRPYFQERLTVAYSAHVPDDDAAPVRHLVVVQLQLKF